MRRDTAGNLHFKTPAERAAVLILWAEQRGVKLSATPHDIIIDVTYADIRPLTDAQFQSWIDSVNPALHAILLGCSRPPTIH